MTDAHVDVNSVANLMDTVHCISFRGAGVVLVQGSVGRVRSAAASPRLHESGTGLGRPRIAAQLLGGAGQKRMPTPALNCEKFSGSDV